MKKKLNDMMPAKINALSGKTIYITGATGLIGSNLVKKLLSLKNNKIVVQVRNEIKAKKLFGDKVEYVICDLAQKSQYKGEVDYIIHCANATSSKFFVDNPVETITSAVNGTINALEFAKEKQVNGFVFLSTMEVYGMPREGCRFRINGAPFSRQRCKRLAPAVRCPFIACL